MLCPLLAGFICSPNGRCIHPAIQQTHFEMQSLLSRTSLVQGRAQKAIENTLSCFHMVNIFYRPHLPLLPPKLKTSCVPIPVQVSQVQCRWGSWGHHKSHYTPNPLGGSLLPFYLPLQTWMYPVQARQLITTTFLMSFAVLTSYPQSSAPCRIILQTDLVTAGLRVPTPLGMPTSLRIYPDDWHSAVVLESHSPSCVCGLSLSGDRCALSGVFWVNEIHGSRWGSGLWFAWDACPPTAYCL